MSNIKINYNTDYDSLYKVSQINNNGLLIDDYISDVDILVNNIKNDTKKYISFFSKEELFNTFNKNDLSINNSNKSLESNFYSNKEFLINYFKNLNTNKPINYDGICGFTAISMFLSYYDVYWNDLIIPNEYQLNQLTSEINNYNDYSIFESPGVKDIYISHNDYIKKLEEESLKELYTNKDGTIDEEKYKKYYEKYTKEWIDALINSGTFLGKLIEIAKENNLFFSCFDDRKYLNNLGVSYKFMYNLLLKYVENINFSNDIMLFYNHINNDENYLANNVRNDIIKHLKKNQPVIVGGENYTDLNKNNKYDNNEPFYGHVVVAYDYDIENDIIYGHMGWDKDSTYYVIDSFFNKQISDYYYIVIENNFYHKHSEVFINTVDNQTNTICSCNLLSHNHNYLYSKVNDDCHYKNCICLNEYLIEKHNFNKEKLINGKYYVQCNGCNYLIDSTSSVIKILD